MAERKLPDDPVAFIRDCLRGGRILWTYHVNMRLGQRFIARETIIAAAESYEIVEAYRYVETGQKTGNVVLTVSLNDTGEMQ